VDERARTRAVVTPPELRGDKRRRTILKALHDCVIEHGYPKTTLASVARAAGMSPSHLLYYFPGKDAILEQYFADVSQRIVGRIQGFRKENPERQIVLLADLFFGGRNVTKSEIGFMLECFGAAVHDERLNREKTELDRYCKSYLQELFEQLPCGPARARDAAELAYAMLVGLRTASYFDEQLSPAHARQLFYAEVSNLAEVGRIGRTAWPRGR
jgi:AcrR family transcriptional regulator